MSKVVTYIQRREAYCEAVNRPPREKNPDDEYEVRAQDPIHFDGMDENNLVTSLTMNGTGHVPVIDIDVPIYVIPSATPGHGHLYIDKEITWDQYKNLLYAFVRCGILEHGYYKATVANGFSCVRKPGVAVKQGQVTDVERIKEHAQAIVDMRRYQSALLNIANAEKQEDISIDTLELLYQLKQQDLPQEINATEDAILNIDNLNAAQQQALEDARAGIRRAVDNALVDNEAPIENNILIPAQRFEQEVGMWRAEADAVVFRVNNNDEVALHPEDQDVVNAWNEFQDENAADVAQAYDELLQQIAELIDAIEDEVEEF